MVELTGDKSHLLMPQKGYHVLQIHTEAASSLVALSYCQDEAITSKWLGNRSCRSAPGVQAGGTAGDDRLSLWETMCVLEIARENSFYQELGRLTVTRTWLSCTA